MRNLVIGTAGHVDHGKSTLVRALTGINPDRLKEEQARGITIDLGFAHAEIGGVEVAFVDVPGHERFVRNMLAGAGGIDAVLLVVAADESVMPQTREHFHICRLLGVEQGIIAITKSDVADDAMLVVVEEEARALVAGTGLSRAPVVRLSAQTGAGLDELRDAISGLGRALRREARRDVVRLPIDRVFTVRGFGTVVTGTLVSGVVERDGELIVLPGEQRVRVRGIQMHARTADVASAPHRVALNLAGIQKEALARGMTLATANGLTVTRRLDARVQLLDDGDELRHGARVRVHQGTSETTARVLLAAVRNGPGDPWRGIVQGELRAAVPPGGEAYMRLRLQNPVVVTRGDRFVVRALSPAATIAGGVVLDPDPPAGGLRRAGAVTRYLNLESTEHASDLWVSASGVRGLTVRSLVSRGGLSAADAEAVAERATGSNAAVRVGEVLFAAATIATAGESLARVLADHHRQHPLEAGMPREALRDAVGLGSAPDLFDHVLRVLAARSVIHGSERVALHAHRPSLNVAEAQARARVLTAVREAGLSGADTPALVRASDADARTIDDVARLLIREHQIVKLDALYFETAALRQLKADVQGMRTGSSPAAATLDVAAFKSRFGLSRKSAIPLLEWLDRERVTRRAGDTRIIL